MGGESFEFEPRDTFVVPSWAPVRLEAKGECVLFSFSDRPGQEAMGLLERKTRMNAPDKGFLSREYNNRELVPEHPQFFARWARARCARAAP